MKIMKLNVILLSFLPICTELGNSITPLSKLIVISMPPRKIKMVLKG
jgi:hypothetical protein